MAYTIKLGMFGAWRGSNYIDLIAAQGADIPVAGFIKFHGITVIVNHWANHRAVLLSRAADGACVGIFRYTENVMFFLIDDLSADGAFIPMGFGVLVQLPVVVRLRDHGAFGFQRAALDAFVRLGAGSKMVFLFRFRAADLANGPMAGLIMMLYINVRISDHFRAFRFGCAAYGAKAGLTAGASVRRFFYYLTAGGALQPMILGIVPHFKARMKHGDGTLRQDRAASLAFLFILAGAVHVMGGIIQLFPTINANVPVMRVVILVIIPVVAVNMGLVRQSRGAAAQQHGSQSNCRYSFQHNKRLLFAIHTWLYRVYIFVKKYFLTIHYRISAHQKPLRKC